MSLVRAEPEDSTKDLHAESIKTCSETYDVVPFQATMDQSLKACFENLLKPGPSQFSDVSIVSRDGKEFPCHKVILSARSHALASLIRELPPQDPPKIKLNDLSGKIVEVIIYYLYTGQLKNWWCDPEVIVELTYAAQKYELKEILEVIGSKLGGKSWECFVRVSFPLITIANKISLKEAEHVFLNGIKEFVVSAGKKINNLEVALL